MLLVGWMLLIHHQHFVMPSLHNGPSTGWHLITSYSCINRQRAPWNCSVLSTIEFSIDLAHWLIDMLVLSFLISAYIWTLVHAEMLVISRPIDCKRWVAPRTRLTATTRPTHVHIPYDASSPPLISHPNFLSPPLDRGRQQLLPRRAPHVPPGESILGSPPTAPCPSPVEHATPRTSDYSCCSTSKKL
jgi:hypothetical protein